MVEELSSGLEKPRPNDSDVIGQLYALPWYKGSSFHWEAYY